MLHVAAPQFKLLEQNLLEKLRDIKLFCPSLAQSFHLRDFGAAIHTVSHTSDLQTTGIFMEWLYVHCPDTMPIWEWDLAITWLLLLSVMIS